MPTIIATRHVSGDVEYIFLVNATPDNEAADAKGNPEHVTPKAVEATIGFSNDDRPIYDAIVGGNVLEINPAAKDGKFRFGPGQMACSPAPAGPSAFSAASSWLGPW